MTRNRAALAIPAALVVLSGCGVAAAVVTSRTTASRTTTDSLVIAQPAARDASPTLGSLPRTVVAPAPSATPTTPATPTAPAASVDVVATVATSGPDEWLEILSHTGRVLAKTEINPTMAWMTAAGAGGAYWTQNNAEYELSPSGTVRKLGAVPSDATSVLIDADGQSYAYATSDQPQSGVITNRIVVVRPGMPAATIADRIYDPNHPTADLPNGWQYYLTTWTPSGIVFARVPTGGCGCGSFDMQMQSGDSWIINPTTRATLALPEDWSCPLSTVGPAMESACFTGDSGTTGLRVSTGGAATYHFAMSGANLAGDAVFSPAGTQLAYVTIPNAQTDCGAPWTATLRVLTLASGAAASRTLGEFSPAAWASNGFIYGSIVTGTTSSVVAVNSTTLTVTHLTPASGSSQFVGVM